MPSNTSSLGPCAAAWGAVRDRIQQHAGIRRRRIIWRMPEDVDFDNAFPDETIGIRLIPKVTASDRIASLGAGRYLKSYTLTITVEMSHPSQAWEDAADLAEDIENAVQGSDLTPIQRVAHDAAYAAASVFDVDVSVRPDWQQPGTILVTVMKDS